MEQDEIQFAKSLQSLAADLSSSIPDFSIPYFFRYLGELKKWNKAINLTAIDDDREILAKHFIDSIAGLKVIDINHETELLDVGAGAGFPALPLKFVRPELLVELLEPSEKKGAFLRYVVGSLGLQNVTVTTAKLEDYAGRGNAQGRFDYIVVRAFKVDQFGMALSTLLKQDGKLVLYRAEKVPRSFELVDLALIKEVEYELPAKYGHRVLSVFSKSPG
ncbi:MAG: 16S rRNA (guanine(527)-N(7))-methyltransferase RsmG [Nitrospira sp.]|nr:16S rRNA (guanine(527)-N(7))-methyltransferase RsmG [Nitrospira sp.]